MTNRFKHISFPWYTTLFSVVLIAYFTVLVFLSSDGSVEVEEMLTMGAPSAISIYNGHLYGLITNTLIHENIWHLLLSLGGLWTFGFYLENYKGWKFLSVFGFFSALVGSIIQLAFSDDAGVGISSSLFALCTYSSLHTIFIRKENIKIAIPVALLIAGSLLFFMISNLWLDDKVTIGAKVAGSLWGIFFFYSERLKSPYKHIAPLAVVFILSFTVVYAPWSSMWQTTKGIEAHNNQELELAEGFYHAALELDGMNGVATENIRRIKVYKLSLLAFDAHENGRFSEARRYYLKILALGRNNRWVLENLKELP